MSVRVAVIGVGLTECKYSWPDISQTELVNLAVKRALENAQLTLKDIDVVIQGSMEPFEGVSFSDMWLVEGSGAYMKSGMRLQSGGTTGATLFSGGYTHCSSGVFDVVMVVAHEKMDEGSGSAVMRYITQNPFYNVGGGGQGATNAIAAHAADMLARGAITEDLVAECRVKQAECGARNPYAHLRKKITVDDVKKSRLLTWPVRMFHMCPTSCGACAVILASEKKVKKLSNNPAWIVDCTTVRGGMSPELGEFNISYAAGPLGPLWMWGVEQACIQLYKRNGITNPRKEFDVIEVYEPSTWSEIGFYERMHICEPGKPYKLIEEKATTIGGDIPVNPSGGVTCSNPIGATALIRMAEAAIQIRGEGGERQVPGAKTALAIGQGGDHYATAALFKKTLT